MTTTPAPARAWRLVPPVRWLPRYRRAWLGPDLVAGAVVASVAVPTAMGYAGVALAPPQAGLYALPGALLAYAVLGSSRQLSVGPSSTVALMSGAVVAGAIGGGASGGDPGRAAALTAGIAIAAGLLLALVGLLRLGWITDFMSRPVTVGFAFGLGVTVIVGELPHVLGLPPEPTTFVPRLTSTLGQLDLARPGTLAVGVATLAVLVVGSRLVPRIPWALVVVAAGIAVAPALAGLGLETVGAMPAGLPALGLPALSAADLGTVALGGAAVALVGIGEGLTAARVFAARSGDAIDADQEFVGVGAADVAAGLSGGVSVCGSLSRTAAAVGAGARTQVSAVTAAVLTIVVLLFLTGLLAQLPRVVLSAVVVVSVWFLLDVPALAGFWRVRRNDGVAATVALAGVLLLGPLWGLLVAVAVSLLGLAYRASRIVVDPLGRIPTERAGWGALRASPDRRPVPGLLVLRLSSPLFWANAARTSELVLTAVDAEPGVRGVVLDLEATDQLDATAVDALQALLDALRDREVDLFLARVMFRAHEVMARAGFEADLGPGRIWHSISGAVTAATTHLALPDEEPPEWGAPRTTRDGSPLPRPDDDR